MQIFLNKSLDFFIQQKNTFSKCQNKLTQLYRMAFAYFLKASSTDVRSLLFDEEAMGLIWPAVFNLT